MSEDQRSPFSKRVVVLVGSVAVGSLILGIALAVFGSKVSRAPISDANAYSRSAVGHKAFAELLRRLDVPVVVSQYGSAKKVRSGAVLILAEPQPVSQDIQRAFQLVRDTNAVILVLPKWGSKPDPRKKAWIAGAGLLPTRSIQWVAQDVLGIDAEVSRSDRLGALAVNKLSARPELTVPQLITSDELDPVVATESGMLVGHMELDGKDVLVLSDPDIIATHGIGKGENAQFAVALVDWLRDSKGAVVFDETIHGFLKKPSVYRALLEFPLVVATLQVLCAVLLLLWAGIGRFGAARAPQPAIEPGKRFLIDNTASLLQFGGHTSHTLQRYYNSIVRDVARQLHAPDVDDAAREAWLERVANGKGVTVSLVDIRHEISAIVSSRRVHPRAVVLTANRLYQWKQEMLHGPASNPGPH